MGRRGNLGGRLSFRCLVIIAGCLGIFYLTVTSLMSPDIKAKHVYSQQGQGFLSELEKLKTQKFEEFEGRSVYHKDKYSMDNALNNMKGSSEFMQEHAQYFVKEYSANNTSMTTSEFVIKPSNNKGVLTPSDKLYRRPNSLINITVTSMERFVHLDLKGAAPRMSYLRSFIPMIAKLGATGLLIEYEDMFPYTGKLQDIRANNAYSLHDLSELLYLASMYNVKVMPLIQTFNHMEFALKSEFINLRESENAPQTIDITNNAAYGLIQEIIQQILSVHPNITHLHIGCGEAYGLGKGLNIAPARERTTVDLHMFLQHANRVANIVRQQTRDSVTPVMWDDMLRKMPLIDIENSKLSSLVEIMVWQSSGNVGQFIGKEVWYKYAKEFKSVWIASAFKSATRVRQVFTEPHRYLRNQLSWLTIIAENKHQLDFKGVALIGLQRFDHFSTLCELLPVAIPSLAICLATMKNSGFTESIHIETSAQVLCQRAIELSFSRPENDQSSHSTHNCLFPGHELYSAVERMHGHRLITSMSTNIQDGWLSDYQIAHSSSSPNQLRTLDRLLTKDVSFYLSLAKSLVKHLAVIYFEDTVDEWVDENIFEPLRNIKQMRKKIKFLHQFKAWPKHPFLPINADTGVSSEFDGINKTNLIMPTGNDNSIQYVSPFARAKNLTSNSQVLPDQINQSLPHKTLSATLENQQNTPNVNSLAINSDQTKTSVTSKTSTGVSDSENAKFIGDMFIDDKIEVPHLPNTNNMETGEYSTEKISDKVSLLYLKKIEDMNYKITSSVYINKDNSNTNN